MSSSENNIASVSIVLPAYNVEETIEECVNSLVQQDHGNVELIVVNDGSTDETPNILRKLSTRHKMEIINTRHCGRSGAKNIGVAQSHGEVIAFAEADAKYDRKWVSSSVKYLRNNVAAVVGPRYCWFTDTAVSKAIDLKLRLRYHDPSYIPFTGWAFKKNAFAEVQGFDPQLVVAEDRDLGMRVSKKGYGIAFASDAIVFHKEPDSLSEFVRKEYRHGAERTSYYRKYPHDYPFARVGIFWSCLGLAAYGLVSFWPITLFFVPPVALILVLAQYYRLHLKAKRSRVPHGNWLLLYASLLDYIRNLSSILGATVAGISLIPHHLGAKEQTNPQDSFHPTESGQSFDRVGHVIPER